MTAAVCQDNYSMKKSALMFGELLDMGSEIMLNPEDYCLLVRVGV